MTSPSESGKAPAAAAPDSVPWLSLPSDLWLRIFAASGDTGPVPWDRWRKGGGSPVTNSGWLQHTQQLARLQATCRTFQQLTLRPTVSQQLWGTVAVAPEYAGMHGRKVPGLMKFLARYAPLAQTAIVCGGAGMDIDEMRGLLSQATQLRSCVLYNVVSRDLAMALSSAFAISGAQLEHVHYEGTQLPPVLPSSVTCLDATFADSADIVEEPMEESFMSPHEDLTSALARLSNLHRLATLRLVLPEDWTLTRSDGLNMWRCFPRLSTVCLVIAVHSVPCHDLCELVRLKGCRILLSISAAGAMVEFMKQLKPVPLHVLAISANKLSIKEQRLLSACKIADTLALNLHTSNSYIKFVPKGCQIRHNKLIL